jgi:hypothetical protein
MNGGGWRRFSSPSVVLARADLLAEARTLAARIRRLEHPEYIREFEIYPEKRLGGDETRALVILKKVFAWSLQKLGNPVPKREWSLRIVDSAVNTPLVRYFPDSAVLEMQRKALETFRETDMVVVGIHELTGHHMQESNVLAGGDHDDYYHSARTNTQEGCAMACERSLLTGPLERTGLEWQLFRLLRALEDDGVTTAWAEFPEGHRMPRAYVRQFVKDLPGTAQHYVFMTNDEFCEC